MSQKIRCACCGKVLFVATKTTFEVMCAKSRCRHVNIFELNSISPSLSRRSHRVIGEGEGIKNEPQEGREPREGRNDAPEKGQE